MTPFAGPHDWPSFQDHVLTYGVPVHPTAPMAYELWLRAIVTARRDRCGCIACYDVAVPSRVTHGDAAPRHTLERCHPRGTPGAVKITSGPH